MRGEAFAPLVHNVSKQFTQVDPLSGGTSAEPAVFDRTVLMHHAMDDAALATEVLALFEAQLQRLEHLDWDKLDLAFEMHTLRGAAAAVGASQLRHIAENWKDTGAFEATVKTAIKNFRAKVLN